MIHFHLFKKPGGWTLFEAAHPQIIRNYRGKSKEETVLLAAEHLLAHRSGCLLRIHREDGTVEEERTYLPGSRSMAA